MPPSVVRSSPMQKFLENGIFKISQTQNKDIPAQPSLSAINTFCKDIRVPFREIPDTGSIVPDYPSSVQN